MLGTLLKKQLMEIFRGYFYNNKKNQKRTKANTVMMFVLFGVLMVGVMGGLFTMVSLGICSPLSAVGMGWLYFLIMGLIGLLLGAFGSVFNTFTGLYKAKDNDLLLSMPIPVNVIMTARLLAVYLMGLMYSACVTLPAVIVYWIINPVSVMSVVGGIAMILTVSVIVFVLSCLLGWVVAKISTKIKNKSFVSVFAALLGIGIYYFVYFKAQILIQDIAANAAEYGTKIRGSSKALYIFGSVGTGDVKAVITFVIVSALLLFLTWQIIARTFISIITSTGKTAKKEYRETAAKQSGIPLALLRKEFGKFTSSPNYMLNCGLNMVFLVAIGILALIKGDVFTEILTGLLVGKTGAIPAIICAVVCTISTMNEIVTPSVSLEGRSIWIPQSLPIEPKYALFAKMNVQLILNGIATLFAALCCAAVFAGNAAEFIFIIVEAMACVFFFAEFDLFLAIQMPNLTWTNEITPVKQAGNIAIGLFSGFAYAFIVGGGYILIGYKIGFVPFMAAITAVSLAAGALLHRWTATRGAVIFANL